MHLLIMKNDYRDVFKCIQSYDLDKYNNIEKYKKCRQCRLECVCLCS